MTNPLAKGDPFIFTIAREVDAPREEVWRAFTDAEQIKQWFGPKGCTIPFCQVELKPGGAARYCMEYNGVKMWGKWAYKELRAPERLVAIVSFTDETGKVIPHPASPDWPLEILSTVTFIENHGRTAINVEWTPHNASDREREVFAEGHESMRQGWGGSLEMLAEWLEDN